MNKENCVNAGAEDGLPPSAPSPMDKRKIFSLTSVSPFVRVATQQQEKKKMQKERVPETRDEDGSPPSSPAAPPPVKPYALPKEALPPMPKENLKQWFNLLAEARAERDQALASNTQLGKQVVALTGGIKTLRQELDTVTATATAVTQKYEQLREDHAEAEIRFEGTVYEIKEQSREQKAKSDVLLKSSQKRYSDAVNAWTDKHELLKNRLEEQKKQTQNAIEAAKAVKEECAEREAQARVDAEIVANKKNLATLQQVSKLEKEVGVLKSRLRSSKTVGRQGGSTSESLNAAFETNKRLKEELKASEGEAATMRETIVELEDAGVKSASECQALQKEVETLKQFMRRRISETEKAKEVVSDLLRNARAERATIQKEKEVLAHKLKVAQEEMAHQRRDAQTKDLTEKRLGQRNSSLLKECDELKRQIVEFNANLTNLDGEKRRLLKTLDQKGTELTDSHHAIKKLTDECNTLRRETAAALKQQKHFESKCKALEGEVRFTSTELKEAKEKMRDALRAMKKMTTEMNVEREERREETAALTAKCEVARSKLAEGLNAKHKIVMQMAHTKQHLANVQEQCAKLEASLARSNAAVQEATAKGERDVTRCRKEFSKKMVIEMKMLREGHSKANFQVESAHTEIDRLRKELDRTREAYLERERTHVEQRVRLEMQQLQLGQREQTEQETLQRQSPPSQLQDSRVEKTSPRREESHAPRVIPKHADVGRPPLQGRRKSITYEDDEKIDPVCAPDVRKSSTHDAILEAQRYIQARKASRRQKKE